MVCCFRHAEMDKEAESKISCIHQFPRKHYWWIQWKPLSSLSPFPFPSSLSHRENAKISSHHLHPLHPCGSPTSSFPASHTSPMMSLVSNLPLYPHQDPILVLTCSLVLGWEPVSEVPLGLHKLIARTPQTSDPMWGSLVQLPSISLRIIALGTGEMTTVSGTQSAHCDLVSISQLLLMPAPHKPHSNGAPSWHFGPLGSMSAHILCSVVVEMFGYFSSLSVLSPEKWQSFSLGKDVTHCLVSGSFLLRTHPPLQWGQSLSWLRTRNWARDRGFLVGQLPSFSCILACIWL